MRAGSRLAMVTIFPRSLNPQPRRYVRRDGVAASDVGLGRCPSGDGDGGAVVGRQCPADGCGSWWARPTGLGDVDRRPGFFRRLAKAGMGPLPGCGVGRRGPAPGLSGSRRPLPRARLGRQQTSTSAAHHGRPTHHDGAARGRAGREKRRRSRLGFGAPCVSPQPCGQRGRCAAPMLNRPAGRIAPRVEDRAGRAAAGRPAGELPSPQAPMPTRPSTAPASDSAIRPPSPPTHFPPRSRVFPACAIERRLCGPNRPKPDARATTQGGGLCPEWNARASASPPVGPPVSAAANHCPAPYQPKTSTQHRHGPPA